MQPMSSFRLEDFVPYRLSVLTNTVSRAIAALYSARFGLTIPEWRVMAVLGRFAPLSSNEVAARSAMDKVQVSRAVERLRRKKLVARATDRDDRRRHALRLTEAGLTMHGAIVPLALAVERKFLARLPAKDRALLRRLLDRMTAAAGSIQRDAGQ